MTTPRPAAIAALALASCALAASAAGQSRPQSHSKGKVDEYNRALGVECAHCHVPDQWADDSKPAKATARKMADMVVALNGKLRGVGEVGCWTCHRGSATPSRLPQEAMDAELARWPASIAAAGEGTKRSMAMYSASTGLRCGQCHDVTDWKRKDTDRMRMVPRMMALFPVMQPHMPETGRPTCFTCHKGSNKPPKDPPGR